MNKRICLQCSSQLRGRTDKKYCSERCRARSGYVLKKRQAADPVSVIDARLKRNRYILGRFMSLGASSVTRAQLLSSGFDFALYTTIKSESPDRLSIYCYDMGYSIVDDTHVRIFEVTISPA